MSKHRFMNTVISAIGITCLMQLPISPRVFAAQQQQSRVESVVKFQVMSASDYAPVSGARIIVIGENGEIQKTGLTNAHGVWAPTLSVAKDERFGEIGIVTAIGVATGYNENVVFEVPVKQGTVQPIILYPIKPRLRNEATASLGQFHHLDIIALVNHYAKELGLAKQTAVTGEQGYAPWGPDIQKGR